MAISSTVVAKLGGNVEYVALDGNGKYKFSVTLPSGTWLIECGFYASNISGATPEIGGKRVGKCPPDGGGTATVVTAGGTVNFSGNSGTQWGTGVAIKLA